MGGAPEWDNGLSKDMIPNLLRTLQVWWVGLQIAVEVIINHREHSGHRETTTEIGHGCTRIFTDVEVEG
jgi:hypothetical protein